MHDDIKNTTPDSHKKKRIVIGVSALLVTILAAGGAVAIYQHSASAQLVEAKEACAQASETLRVARNKYDTLHDRDAAEAAKITGKQVEDGDTVTVLAAAYKETVPDLAACNVDGVDGLREATAQIDKDAAWYDMHTASLSKAVDAVNESHDAKTLKDAKEALSKQLTAAQKKYKATDGKVQDDKTRKDLKAMIDKATKTRDGKDVKAMNSQAKQLKNLMGKADASVKAKQAAEEQARKEAEAQAAAQANAQAQQQYVAPQQSYTPTYTAPQYTAPAAPQYTAPQQTTPQYTTPQQTAPKPAAPAAPSTGGNSGGGPVSGGHGCGSLCTSTTDTYDR